MTVKFSGAELEAFARRVGAGAHAEGSMTIATGLYSHAEGGGSSTATGNYAHAEGYNASASGASAHAEGDSCAASGTQAHAEGSLTTASGNMSHAEGYSSTASQPYAHAGGYSGKADASSAWARGSQGGVISGATRAQVAIYTLGISTVTTTPAVMTFDGSATPTATNTLAIPANANYLFELNVTARRSTGTSMSAGWVYKGLAARDGASARLVGTVTQVASWADVTIGSVSVAVDTATNTLRATVTANSAAYTTGWFATLIVTEQVFA